MSWEREKGGNSPRFAENGRLFLWAPVFLGLGIAFYFSLQTEPDLSPGLLVILLAILSLWFFRGHFGLFLIFSALLLAATGFSLGKLRTLNVHSPMLVKKVGPAGIKGRVIGLTQLPKGQHVVLDKVRMNGINPATTPEQVRLKLLGDQPHLALGDWVSAFAVVSPPAAPVAPGAFDFQRHSYFQGIGGIGFAIGTVKVIAHGKDNQGWSYSFWLDGIRQDLAERIRQALPGEQGAVAAALMIGEKKAISDKSIENLRNAGLAHLLAISGLHVGLVSGMIFLFLRSGLALIPSLALYHPIKKWAALIALAGALVYTQLAGATVPTQRAFIMIGLVFVAVLFDRRGISMRTVALAALIILCIRPESLLGPSFQMSFAAVIALVAVYEWGQRSLLTGLSKRLREGGPLARPVLYIGGVAITTLVAGLATAPIALYHFNQIASYGMAANLIAVPLAALWVMPWAIVSFILMPLGLEGLGLTPMGWGIDGILAVAAWVSGWSGSTHLLPAMPVWGLAALVLGGLWLCLWPSRHRLAGVLPVAIGLGSVFIATPPDILVDGEGKLAAVLGGDRKAPALLVSDNRKGAFEKDIWLRRAGLGTVKPWPKAGQSPRQNQTPRDDFACDHLGCLFRKGAITAALVKQPGALLEDCWQADIVISLIPVRRDCPGPEVIIDRFDLWRKGAHAIWLDDQGIIVKTVGDERGNRPWVVNPAGAQRKSKL